MSKLLIFVYYDQSTFNFMDLWTKEEYLLKKKKKSFIRWHIFDLHVAFLICNDEPYKNINFLQRI